MDGVILDGMPFHVEAWEKAFGHYGMQIDRNDLYLLEGVKSRDVVEWLSVNRGMNLSDDQRDAVATLKQRIYADLFRVVPLRGGPELVRLLAGFGYEISLVTGTSHVAATHMLKELSLQDDIPFVVSADSVTRGKPAPDPYSLALDLLSVVRTNCIAIENSPVGLESASSAGLPCVAVATYLPASALCKADRVFETLDELQMWFTSEFRASNGIGPWQPGDRFVSPSVAFPGDMSR